LHDRASEAHGQLLGGGDAVNHTGGVRDAVCIHATCVADRECGCVCPSNAGDFSGRGRRH